MDNQVSFPVTVRQKILKFFYPIFRRLTNLVSSKNLVLHNVTSTKPLTPFYNLYAIANDGTLINFDRFKGKKVLLVNTASNCGYTGQYDDLQKLYEQYKSKLVVLGFPANDFKEQEKGSDEEINQFCKINYGVTFPLMKKSSVIRGTNQNKVYEWLSNKSLNGWNDQEPVWNFTKYLVNEEGILLNYFSPAVSPLDDEIINAINTAP
jgi:glutathione peroxidase